MTCSNGGGLYSASRPDGQSTAPGARLDLGGRSRGAGTAQIERTLKLKMERLQRRWRATEANDSKHASLANSDRFAGRSACIESLVLLPGRQAGNLQVSG